MSDYICGIKYFGDSIIVSENPIGSDLSSYDYICTVSEIEDINDNKSYDVSIVNKENAQGMPVGKWKIKKAKIYKDWGRSISYLIMEDEQGIETSLIKACQKDAGTRTSVMVSLSFLTRAIFTKAQEIVREYPNATLYNTLQNLEKNKNEVERIISLYKSKENKSDEDYMKLLEDTTSLCVEYVKMFNKTITLLKTENNPKYKELSMTITSECKNIIEDLKDCQI